MARKRAQSEFRVREKKRVPYDFVLDELRDLDPVTRPMFGCTAVYVGERILFVLREKDTETHDNGVWLATTTQHHEFLKKDFPTMRSIRVLGDGVTGWQILPASEDSFEDDVLRACAFIRANDARIGKVPAKRR